MKKAKRIYCRTSFVLGTLLLLIVVFMSLGQRVHATDATRPQGGRTVPDVESTQYDTREGIGNTYSGTDHNGVYFSYNNDSGEVSGTIRILLVLTILSLAPSILIMMTSFTRIIIVLHFVRNALGTMTAPPNQVMIGLALFLTLFIMQPVLTQINEEAIKPLDAGEITQEEAFEIGMQPIRQFMYNETQETDLALFCDIAGVPYPENQEQLEEVPVRVLIPSFILSELRTAFIIGFTIYIPFIVIDMVVASVLMSMGMMMLPPTTVSLPFKILLFILADGWNLVIGELVRTFY
ncbi:MAG: flagellar type III secretion system pore protein FliP [Lachnospiraceae bacterium]|nr:flagellar type III secretion system pore protein FliP [Lachnospiraceae bacterium]